MDNNGQMFPTHRIILGLDISTACIGASLVLDDGGDKPEIIKITHVSPKISKKIKGIEALFLKKKIFQEEFLNNIVNEGITDVIIEEPLLSSNNINTVATLLRFNGMISDAIYETLGIVPNFISSYDARMFSFPQLVCLRKYNKKGEEYPLRHVLNDIKNDNIVLFGAYPYDIDKKTVMMDMVNEIYTDINWVLNKKGELRKENYDACDSLICVLAYININHNGIEKPTIENHSITENGDSIKIEYSTKIWNKIYNKEIILSKNPISKKGEKIKTV